MNVLSQKIKQELENEVIACGPLMSDKTMKLIEKYFNALSMEMSKVICPISAFTAPFVVSCLELYAESIRKQHNIPDDLVKDFKKLNGITEIIKETETKRYF